MLSYATNLVVGFIGTALICIFVIGLSHSISTGFAGFFGGLPFMVIVIIVLGMAIYDFWDECVRRRE